MLVDVTKVDKLIKPHLRFPKSTTHTSSNYPTSRGFNIFASPDLLCGVWNRWFRAVDSRRLFIPASWREWREWWTSWGGFWVHNCESEYSKLEEVSSMMIDWRLAGWLWMLDRRKHTRYISFWDCSRFGRKSRVQGGCNSEAPNFNQSRSCQVTIHDCSTCMQYQWRR